MRKAPFVIASSAFAFTLACSEPSEPLADSREAPSSDPATKPSPTTPSPPETKPEPLPPEPPEPKPTGVVSVHQASADHGMSYRAGASARFGSKVGPSADTCTTTTHGPCTVSVCSSPTNTGSPPPSAGRVWFNLPDRVLELTQQRDGTYAEAAYEERLFQPNDKLSASAEGATFPAFSLEVSAPPNVTMLFPALDNVLQAEPIDRKKPYTLKWQTASSGAAPVIVSATILATKPPVTTLHVCEAKLEDGSLTIPQSAVALIGETKGVQAGGMLFVSTSRRKTMSVGSEVARFEVISTHHSAVIEPFN